MNGLARVASRDVMIAAMAGIVVGAAAAYTASVELSQFLFQVAPRWPAAYAAVSGSVLAVVILAAWAPVKRFGRLSLTSLLAAE
jgi:uncharacterized membrane protein required for colicin V production